LPSASSASPRFSRIRSSSPPSSSTSTFPTDLRETVTQGAVLAAIGTVIGLGACLVAAPWVQPLLFRTEARDPLVLGAVSAVILSVACLASLPPGLRATRVDPMEALRAE